MILPNFIWIGSHLRRQNLSLFKDGQPNNKKNNNNKMSTGSDMRLVPDLKLGSEVIRLFT